jgi:predicted nucleic acid-binding protein
MALEQLKVKEIVRRAVNKEIDVPEFQRDFVWDPEQVKLLAESLYREYPVGSFLLWDSSAYREAKIAEGAKNSSWIVDGQQRTTALCILFGEKPYWWPSSADWNKTLARYDVMVNLLTDGDVRLEFALSNPIREKDPRWMSLREILSKEKVEEFTKLAQERVGQLASSPSQAMELFAKIHANMQRLWQIRDMEIPIIKISHEVEDVAEIFARLNQAGTRVKEADVVLALAAVYNPGWVREHYIPFRNDLDERGWDLDAGVFIRTMTGIGYGRARLVEVPKGFWNQSNLPGVWAKTRDAISEVIKRLAEYGIMSSELLPSVNALIPLFVLHAKWSKEKEYSFGKALWWFLMASRDGRYSGSAITSLNEDVKAINEASSFDAALSNLLQRLHVQQKIDPTEFLNRYDRKGNQFLRLMLYLILFKNNARDWVDKTRIGYDKTGSPITSGFQPQWHHIYPQNLLNKNSLPIDDIHALANITVLNERTNVSRLSGKPPWKYVLEYNISRGELDEHFIPGAFADASAGREIVEKSWVKEDLKQVYGDFVLKRAELLAKAANEFLLILKKNSN